MSSYYQKINTLYKRDMTKPKKPIILGNIRSLSLKFLKISNGKLLKRLMELICLVLKAPCGLLNRRGKRIITKIKYCDYKDL